MGEYHRISGMIQAGLADLLDPRLDEGQRRSLKALSSLKVAIEPPPALWSALLHHTAAMRRLQSALDQLHEGIRLARRAIKDRDDDALGIQTESIRDELASMAKFLSAVQPISPYIAIPEYAGSIRRSLRSLKSLAAA